MENKSSSIEEEVLYTVQNFLKENDIDSTSLSFESNLLNDLGLDSLDILELFDSLEEKFNIKFPNNTSDYDLLISVGSLARYIATNTKE